MNYIDQKANLLIELDRYEKELICLVIIEKYKLISQNKIKYDEGMQEIIYAYEHISDVYETF